MPLAATDEIGHVSQPLELCRRHEAARYFRAHHLHAGLPLPVTAEAQPVGAEVVVGDPSREEIAGLLPENLDFGPNGLVVPLIQFVADVSFEDSAVVGQNRKLRIPYRE
jgi:hypothetical protein